MHAEYIDVDISTLQQLVKTTMIYVVGTTSLRTLESLYWMGVKCTTSKAFTIAELEMQQWEIYDKWMALDVSPEEAILNLIGYMEQHNMQRIICKTSLLITPAYKQKWVKGIITNFHQPQSTLLLLISSFLGDEWRRIYTHALENNYRFLSYGDGMLIL